MLSICRSQELQKSSDFDHAELRYSVVMSASLSLDNFYYPIAVRVMNISAGGLMASFSGYFALKGKVAVSINHCDGLSGSVAWVRDGKVGIKFFDQIDPLAFLARRGARISASLEESERLTQRFKHLFGGTPSAGEHDPGRFEEVDNL